MDWFNFLWILCLPYLQHNSVSNNVNKHLSIIKYLFNVRMDVNFLINEDLLIEEGSKVGKYSTTNFVGISKSWKLLD